MATTPLDTILLAHGVVAKYTYNDRVFYDTRKLFSNRHNFTRQIKALMTEEHWILHNGQLFITQEAVVTYAFHSRKALAFIADVMRVLQTPVPPNPLPLPSYASVFPAGQPVYYNHQ